MSVFLSPLKRSSATNLKRGLSCLQHCNELDIRCIPLIKERALRRTRASRANSGIHNTTYINNEPTAVKMIAGH